MNLEPKSSIILQLFLYLSLVVVSCGVDHKIKNNLNADSLPESPSVNDLNLTTTVCLIQNGSQPVSHLNSSTLVPARSSKISWTYLDRVSTTVSDENGGYKICQKFPEKNRVTTSLSAQSPFPIGNKLKSEELSFQFTTGVLNESKSIQAPIIYEGIFESNSNGKKLPTNVIPLLASDRVHYDLVSQNFYYDSELSPVADKEGGREFYSTTSMNEPDFTDGNGLIVINSFELNFDYETVAGDVFSKTFSFRDIGKNISDAFDKANADPVYFGMLEPLGGAYSNFRIFILDKTDALVEFGGDKQFCQSASMDQMNGYVASYLERGFINAITKGGGVDAGLIPGPFWSGSNSQGEFFNMEIIGENLNSLGRGEVAYKNLPAADCDEFRNRKASILIIEGDENIFNDIVACWEEVKFSPCDNPDEIITLDNSEFLQNRNLTDLLISNPSQLSYTTRITFGFETSLAE